MFVTTGKLATDVKKPDSTIGRFLRDTFPYLKSLQDEYKATASSLLVEGTRATAGTVGTALDLIVGLIMEPDSTPDAAMMMYPFNTDFHEVVGELARLVSRSPDVELQARAVYAMAECVAAYRAGPTWAPLMYARVREGQFQTGEALQDASPESVEELIRLRTILQERLIPSIQEPFHLAPTFDLTHLGPSQRLAGEADLISAGLLIDIKSNMGLKNKQGARPDTLKPEHLYQLLGYTLLDNSDTYKIQRIALFSARYGDLHEWPLDRAMQIAAGGPVDLAALRQTIWDLMQEEYEII